MNTGTICFLFDQFHIYCLPDVNTRRSTESADERSPKQIQYLLLFENVLLKTTVSSYFRKLFSLEKKLFDNTLKNIYIYYQPLKKPWKVVSLFQRKWIQYLKGKWRCTMKHVLTCLRRSLVFLVILSMAEFNGSPFSFLPVCERKQKYHVNAVTVPAITIISVWLPTLHHIFHSVHFLVEVT